ncbi:hypothetical protein HPB51_026993 [Rhipicephalus microplus]|uniref:C2H2-type domain-containing protein n=1 Tax=Rhipicephalus microplus TaxID=6941 RepID=A0A9J6D1I1_RHIMP|nr:hypothetical protein HPB51_026993 [Rhipicephalus microplus]
MDSARPSSARSRQPWRRHALAPSDSPASPPPQRPRPGTPDSPAAGPSSSACTASPSSGPPGSRAPASSSPAVPLQPRQSILDGDVLWVYLPAPAELQCPVGDRSMKYSGAIWTCRVQSVRRHVEFENGVHVNDRIYVCSVCDSPLTSRPSNHCCLATATLAPSMETPRRRCSVCDVTFTSALGLANHLRCHVDQAGPSGAACARSVRHVSSSTATSLSSSRSPPAAASRASRRLRGLGPSHAAPSVWPSSSPAAGAGVSSPVSIGEPPALVYVFSSGLLTSVGSASLPGSLAPYPAASPVASEQPMRDTGNVTSSWPPHIGVVTPAGVFVDSPASPGSIRPRAFVVIAWRGSPSRGSLAALPVGDAAFLPNDDDHNALTDDVAVSSPPLDAKSSPVVLPGSPVSPASSPSPPASVDEASSVPDEPDEVPEQPKSDNATLQMPPDHTRLLEDQTGLLRSLLRDPPSDEPWGQCESAWTRAAALAVAAVRLPLVRPGRKRRHSDPSNALDIQRLYCRKLAVRSE